MSLKSLCRFLSLLIVSFVVFGHVAHAHPYSDRYYGHAVTMRVTAEQVEIDYAAEIPTQVLLRQMREEFADQARVSGADEAAFNAAIESELRNGLSFSVNGEGFPLRVRENIPPGEGVGDSRFIVYRLHLTVDLPEAERYELELINGNYPDEASFFASEILASTEIDVDDCSLFVRKDGQFKRDESGQWRMDENFRELTLSWTKRSGFSVAAEKAFERIAGEDIDGGHFQSAGERADHAEESVLIEFVKTGEMTPALFLWALFAALFFGAAHAMSPGHGKVLVAGYLVGARGTIRHAVWLGIIVTITHTFSVFLLGAVTLWLSDTIAPEMLYPWIEVLSGLLIVGIGLALIWARLKRWLVRRHHHSHEHGHHHHHHHHDHDDHDHHHHGHSHAPPDDLSWRSLLSMGVSGGLAPCPSAFVVLLTAIAFHRVWLGLILVTAFSVGLGLVLIIIGIVVASTGNRMLKGRETSPLVTALPIVSAVIITIIGCVFTWRGVLSLA